MFRLRPRANRNDALQKENLIDTMQYYVLCKQEERSYDNLFSRQHDDLNVIICFHRPHSLKRRAESKTYIQYVGSNGMI